MRRAAGSFGRPGIVMIAPVSATTKPAPIFGTRSRTCSRCPVGAPSAAGSSEKEYWVLATQTGSVSQPRSEEHTSELQSRFDLVCRLLLEKTKEGLKQCTYAFS